MRTTLRCALIAACATSTAAAAAPARRLFADGARYLVVEALRDDLVHFELAASGAPDVTKPLYTTPMVAKTDYPGPHTFTADAHTVETDLLRVSVADNLCVTVYDKAQARELNTVCPDGLENSWKNLAISSPGTRNVYGLGQYFAEESADGDWIGRVWDPLADSYGARLRGFAGGANDYSLFPIMYALGDGLQSYALFLDQVYKQMWDFRSAPWKIGMWGDQIRWYVLSGPDLPHLRRSYMELTGRPPVPPKRSFGLWVSEFGFQNFGQVETTLTELRAKHFPVDGFAMDLQWFGGTFGDPDHTGMGGLRWDEAHFPDPASEIRRLDEQGGVRLMLIEEPYVSKLLPVHQAMADKGYLARICDVCGPVYLDYNPWWGRGGMVDFTNPAAGDYWHDDRRQPLADMGVNDHWADLGEPEQYDASAWYYGFPELGKHAHADIHNMYGFRWMESIWRGYERNSAAKRPFLLSRTGTSGIQRFGVGMWSGDIGTNWGNLRSQMNVQMHMSLSGIDYYGSDVGGFQRSSGGIEGGAELLYTQWFAASSALDVPVRPHAWNLDKQRSTSPAERGDTRSNLEALRQRYRLAPYYYSLANQAQSAGDPVFPPLVHYYQADPNVRRLGSEKQIGRDLLVALVADPHAVSRDVYLPAGDWVDFHTHQWFSSAGRTLAGYPLYADGYFRLPLFARAGSLIPMQEVDDKTMNIGGRRQDGKIDTTLRLFAAAAETATAFDLTEDDGETLQRGTTGQAVTRLEQQLTGQVAVVRIGATQGRYAGMPATRSYIVELAARDQEAAAATLNGVDLPACTKAAAAPCFANMAAGTAEIRTGEQPSTAEKKITVALRPADAKHAVRASSSGFAGAGFGGF